MKKNIFYWKLFGLTVGLLLTLGAVYLLIVGNTAKGALMESNQKLNGGIAKSMIAEVKPLVDGEVDTLAIHKVMSSMMVINPSVEVYLLDTEGNIITYVAPYKKVVKDKVPLEPILKFIEDEGNREKCYLGQDPRHDDKQNVFSAAAIEENGKTTGYVYIILAGEDQYAVMSSVFNNYFMKLGTCIFGLALLLGAIVASWLLWRFTGQLRHIQSTVGKFSAQNYKARIDLNEVNDFENLATDFNAMADNISGNIDKIKTLDQMRRDLVANISHDLRTPLSIVQGYSETLLLKKDSLAEEEKSKILETIFRSSTKLNKMVNQLFELSKLEAVETLIEVENFSLADLLNDLVQKYSILAEEKGIDIRLEVDPDLPLVKGDIAMVERVFQNLIDNALKFTERDDHIDIAIKPDGKQILCTVADTGVGMRQEELSIVFERFQQLDRNQPQTKKQGAGLGLAIVKRILDLHQSNIEVMSKVNQGTSFVFGLPAA